MKTTTKKSSVLVQTQCNAANINSMSDMAALKKWLEPGRDEDKQSLQNGRESVFV